MAGRNRYYLAYGSNLNVEQMRYRCPGAELVGSAFLTGWELTFRGSKTGSYLTIDQKEGSMVPVGVWKVTAQDERALDRYEGYPSFYYKQDFQLSCTMYGSGKKRKIRAFAYIMPTARPIGIPTQYYMDVCLEGYDDLGFDSRFLFTAYRQAYNFALSRR